MPVIIGCVVGWLFDSTVGVILTCWLVVLSVLLCLLMLCDLWFTYLVLVLCDFDCGGLFWLLLVVLVVYFCCFSGVVLILLICCCDGCFV